MTIFELSCHCRMLPNNSPFITCCGVHWSEQTVWCTGPNGITPRCMFFDHDNLTHWPLAALSDMLTHCGLMTPYANTDLTVPSHYLNQCWLINSEGQWQSPDGDLTRDASAMNYYNQLENYLPKISFKSPRGQWVKNIIFKLIIQQCSSGTHCEIPLRRMPQNLANKKSGNGLGLSGNKSLVEPVLLQIYVTIWHHWATLS